MKSDNNLDSYAYILRLWRERPAAEQPAVWRFALTDTRSGARRGFGSLEALMAFLRSRLEKSEADDVKREG